MTTEDSYFMNPEEKQIRVIHPETRIINEEEGLVDYVASDETLDCYREVIRASGWKFTHFQKNAPFVDSHNYWSIDKLLGKVVSWRIEKGKLIERVQWAVEAGQDNPLVSIGWKMTVAGFLKAVSVGFFPIRWVDRWDESGTFDSQLDELGLSRDDKIARVFMEQEQIELSSCIIGANPNALAKAYKAGAIPDQDLERFGKLLEAAHSASSGQDHSKLSQERHPEQPDRSASSAAPAARSPEEQQRLKFLKKLNLILNL